MFYSIEDVSRAAATLEMDLGDLQRTVDAVYSFTLISSVDSVYIPLYHFVDKLYRWCKASMNQVFLLVFKTCIEVHEQESVVWPGEKIVAVMEKDCGVNPEGLYLLQDCFKRASEVSYDGTPKLPAKMLSNLEELLTVLRFLFSDNKSHISEFSMAIVKVLLLPLIICK